MKNDYCNRNFYTGNIKGHQNDSDKNNNHNNNNMNEKSDVSHSHSNNTSSLANQTLKNEIYEIHTGLEGHFRQEQALKSSNVDEVFEEQIFTEIPGRHHDFPPLQQEQQQAQNDHRYCELSSKGASFIPVPYKNNDNHTEENHNGVEAPLRPFTSCEESVLARLLSQAELSLDVVRRCVASPLSPVASPAKVEVSVVAPDCVPLNFFPPIMPTSASPLLSSIVFSIFLRVDFPSSMITRVRNLLDAAQLMSPDCPPFVLPVFLDWGTGLVTEGRTCCMMSSLDRQQVENPAVIKAHLETASSLVFQFPIPPLRTAPVASLRLALPTPPLSLPVYQSFPLNLHSSFALSPSDFSLTVPLSLTNASTTFLPSLHHAHGTTAAEVGQSTRPQFDIGCWPSIPEVTEAPNCVAAAKKQGLSAERKALNQERENIKIAPSTPHQSTTSLPHLLPPLESTLSCIKKSSSTSSLNSVRPYKSPSHDTRTPREHEDDVLDPHSPFAREAKTHSPSENWLNASTPPREEASRFISRPSLFTAETAVPISASRPVSTDHLVHPSHSVSEVSQFPPDCVLGVDLTSVKSSSPAVCILFRQSRSCRSDDAADRGERFQFGVTEEPGFQQGDVLMREQSADRSEEEKKEKEKEKKKESEIFSNSMLLPPLLSPSISINNLNHKTSFVSEESVAATATKLADPYRSSPFEKSSITHDDASRQEDDAYEKFSNTATKQHSLKITTVCLDQSFTCGCPAASPCRGQSRIETFDPTHTEKKKKESSNHGKREEEDHREKRKEETANLSLLLPSLPSPHFKPHFASLLTFSTALPSPSNLHASMQYLPNVEGGGSNPPPSHSLNRPEYFSASNAISGV
eukprot:GDKJ01032083.1.p1 GENE.GDKJ01032083.1~~GDKJ01032083.1.p1  ORF type:complete len:950 (+),score=237.05 GDKJ01032083.1:273-2852(+)